MCEDLEKLKNEAQQFWNVRKQDPQALRMYRKKCQEVSAHVGWECRACVKKRNGGRKR
jgi:hypothetical protein